MLKLRKKLLFRITDDVAILKRLVKSVDRVWVTRSTNFFKIANKSVHSLILDFNENVAINFKNSLVKINNLKRDDKVKHSTQKFKVEKERLKNITA